MIDRTSEVLKKYLEGEERRTGTQDRALQITNVIVGNRFGPTAEFNTGDKVLITIEAMAVTRHDDVSVVVQIVDDQAYPLFDTCTDRLGQEPFSLEAGQRVSATFEVDATLAEGTFHVNAYLYRYTTNAPYDKWANAGTFFVSGAPEVRGSVNLKPRLVSFESGSELSSGPAFATVRG
jgi:hypothetical protein